MLANAFRRLAVVAVMLVFGTAAPVRAQDLRIAKAEATYRDIYGAEHSRAAAGTAAARVAFAKKLLAASGQVGDDPALKTVILSKALKIASSTIAGTKTALEIHALLTTDPRAKAEHAGELAGLLEKVLAAEPPAGKPKVAGDLVAAYRDWAAEQCRKSDAGASKSLLRAREVVRIYLVAGPNGKELFREVDDQLKSVDKELQQNKDLARLSNLLGNDPKHVEANVGMALIDLKNNQTKKAAERLAAVNSKPLNKLGATLGVEKPVPRELAADAFIATGAVTSAANKLGLLNLARHNYEAAMAGKFNQAIAREYLSVLIALLPYETATSARVTTAERLSWLAIDIADDAVQAGDADKAAQALAEARAALKRSTGVQAALTELDTFEKSFRTRLDLERERSRQAEILRTNPADPKANWSMAMVLLREGRGEEAAAYLQKNEKAEYARLGALLKLDKASDFEKAESLRAAANGVIGTDKLAFQSAARDYYQSYLQKRPDAPEAGRVKLLIGQLGEGLARKDLLPPGVVALFNDNKKDSFIRLLKEKGAGSVASLDGAVRYASAQSLKVAPDHRELHDAPGWKYPIVENPQIGQYRYVAFAWKKDGGAKLRLYFGKPGDPTWRGYVAGGEAPLALMIAKTVPSEWTLVVRDLFRDFGPMEITGISMNPDDGVAGYFDAIYLGRTEADVRRAATRRSSK